MLVAVALVGTLMSILSCAAIRRRELAEARRAFERTARDRISVLGDHLEENLRALDWVAGFFESSVRVERSEFRTFTKTCLRNHPGIRSVQWAPRVQDPNRAACEAAAREDGLADFRFTEKQTAGAIVRAARREEYFPVYFVETHEGNEAATGLDLASDQALFDTLGRARDSNRAAATAPILAAGQTGNEYSILIVRAVYRDGALMDSVEERREMLKGFVLAELRTQALLEHVLSYFEPCGIDIYLCDPAAPKGQCSPGKHLSRTRTDTDERSAGFCPTEGPPPTTGLHVAATIEAANRNWTVLCVPAPAFLAGEKTFVPLTAMLAGFGFTGLLTLLGLIVLQRIAKSRLFTAQLLRSQRELRDEVAKHKQTELALRESEKRFSLAVEGSNDGIWDWPNVDADEKWWSPRCYELLGYEDGEIEASFSNLLNLLHPDDLERVKGTIRRHLEQRETADAEFRLKTKTGEYRWCRGRGQAVWGEDGKALRMSGSIQDITEQKRAEERVLKEKKFSENLVNCNVDGILAYDEKCRCTMWNPGMERIAGVAKEQALGECVFNVFPFLKKAEENRFFYEALAGRTVIARDRPYIAPGTERQGFFEGYYSPLRDVAGKIMGGLAIIRDTTARKRAEEELQKSKSLYQNLVETSHDLIFQCDNQGRFVFLNKAWESTTGYRVEEMLGRHFSEFKKPDVAARDTADFSKLLEGESLAGYETTYATRSGTERYLLFDVVPRYDVSGQLIGTQGTAFDFTERRLAEQALEGLNRELETTVKRLMVANRELADFAHVTAHDLRTPLRGIGSLAGIIASEFSGKLDEHGKELLDMLVGRASRMYEQIGSILEYSEIGRIEEKKRRVNLSRVVEAIITATAPPEDIEIVVTPNLPTLMCNETRVAQVFRNLLDNAVRHMDKPEGRIRIDCQEEDHFWKFSIADNGRGIEEKYFMKIFQLFQTLDNRDEVEATGIGLSMVKKIVEISGGTIWIESEVGMGTTFFFTLPKQEIGANK